MPLLGSQGPGAQSNIAGGGHTNSQSHKHKVKNLRQITN